MKMKSPILYEHIRKHNILVLPCKTTLQKYTKTYRSSFGFNIRSMDILKKKTSTMSPFQRHGGLLVDELKLSQHFNVMSSGHIQGFVDLGTFTRPEHKHQACDHGMVIMFVPFTGKWSQIIGVFATKGNIKGDLLFKIIIEAVIVSEKAGLFVDHISCDGAAWNRKMWQLAGVCASAKKVVCKTEHPVDSKRALHFVSDFPHLIKCLRNGLHKTGFTTPDGHVSIRAVREAFLRDCSVRTLKVMPGLTEAHLDPNSFEKMRVCLAFQLFGTSVLRGMTFYKADIEKVCGSITATQEFFS